MNESLASRIKKVDVVEVHGSKPHKPSKLPGASGGRLWEEEIDKKMKK